MKALTITLGLLVALALVANVHGSSESSESSSESSESSSSSEERLLYRVRRSASESESSEESSSSSSSESSESSESSSSSETSSESSSSDEEAPVARRRRSASSADSNSSEPRRSGGRRNNNRNLNRRTKRDVLFGLADVDVAGGYDKFHHHHYSTDDLSNLSKKLNLDADGIQRLIDLAESPRRNKRATCDLMSVLGWGDTPCAAHCLLKGFKGGWCDSKKICNCRH